MLRLLLKSCAIVGGATGIFGITIMPKGGKDMPLPIVTILFILLWIGLIGLGVYVLYLIIKALRKYIKSEPVRSEKKIAAKNLGEVLKQHRMELQMTQEFVAEALGVSRQAVSKWESGASDPSTTNLMALAKLYGVEADSLLKEVQ